MNPRERQSDTLYRWWIIDKREHERWLQPLSVHDQCKLTVQVQVPQRGHRLDFRWFRGFEITYTRADMTRLFALVFPLLLGACFLDAGDKIHCQVDSHCLEGRRCNVDTCLAVAADGRFLCAGHDDCPGTQACLGGFCVLSCLDEACPTGQRCLKPSGEIGAYCSTGLPSSPCLTQDHCPIGHRCGADADGLGLCLTDDLGELSVVGLSLIGLESSHPVVDLSPGATVDLGSLTEEQVTLAASTKPQPLGSVRFSLTSPLTDLQEYTCDFPPYTLRNSGDLQTSWPLSQGIHTVTATPFSSMGATGREGQSLKMTFTINCIPESDEELCQASMARCDGIAGVDRCGTTRNVKSCGSCGGGFVCQANQCIPDQYTVLLIHSDATEGSASFNDSTKRHEVVPQFGVKHTTAQHHFGATSISFDGEDDFLWVQNNIADWQFNSEAFSIEFWVLFEDLTRTQTLLSQWKDSGNYWEVKFVPPHLEFVLTYNNNSNQIKVMDTYGGEWKSQWYHLVITRSAEQAFSFFRDGNLIGTEIDPDNDPVRPINGDLFIGSRGNMGPPSSWQLFKGALDEIRISKGISRWAVPDAPYGEWTPPSH